MTNYPQTEALILKAIEEGKYTFGYNSFRIIIPEEKGPYIHVVYEDWGDKKQICVSVYVEVTRFQKKWFKPVSYVSEENVTAFVIKQDETLFNKILSVMNAEEKRVNMVKDSEVVKLMEDRL